MDPKNHRQVIETEQDTELVFLWDRVQELAAASRSPNTLGAYKEDWERFCRWCGRRRAQPIPATAETIALYLSEHSDTLKPATLFRHLVSISVVHGTAGLPNPITADLVRSVFRGICRTRGVRQKKVAPLRAEHLKRLDAVLSDSLQGVRDKAICLVGYAGAFRRSELVALNREDVTFVPKGMRLAVHRSKTDQRGKGAVKDINTVLSSQTCPVNAMLNWMEKAEITEGAVFRGISRTGTVSKRAMNPQSIALVVKRVAGLLGLPEDDYSGHSLRAGFVTDGIKNGLSTQVIRMVTGHRSDSALEGYFREADAFAYDITGKLGL